VLWVTDSGRTSGPTVAAAVFTLKEHPA
jgi:hypothetical protein